jgi:hypothetical protein
MGQGGGSEDLERGKSAAKTRRTYQTQPATEGQSRLPNVRTALRPPSAPATRAQPGASARASPRRHRGRRPAPMEVGPCAACRLERGGRAGGAGLRQRERPAEFPAAGRRPSSCGAPRPAQPEGAGGQGLQGGKMAAPSGREDGNAGPGATACTAGPARRAGRKQWGSRRARRLHARCAAPPNHAPHWPPLPLWPPLHAALRVRGEPGRRWGRRGGAAAACGAW